MLPGNVVDTDENISLSNLEKARAAGCSLLVVPEIQAVRVREDNTYYVSLTQTVYRVSDGSVLNAGIFGSNTKTLTPLGALVHNARTMSKESLSWVEAK